MTDTASAASVTTLASIKQNRADDAAAAEAAKIAAQRSDYLSQLANLQPQLEKRLEAVKAEKRNLKTSLANIGEIENDTDATNEELAQLVIEAQIALGVADPLTQLFFGSSRKPVEFKLDLSGLRVPGARLR